MKYVQDFLCLSHNRSVIWIDETGLHLSGMRKSRARSISGTAATLEVQPKSKRLNIIAALSNKGIVHIRKKMCTSKP